MLSDGHERQASVAPSESPAAGSVGKAAKATLSGPPPLRVEIHILDDGRVVFGDLPPELAEVAQILAGELPLLPREPGGLLTGLVNAEGTVQWGAG